MKGSMKKLHNLCVDIQEKYREKCEKYKKLKKRVALLEQVIEDYQRAPFQRPKRVKPLRNKPIRVPFVQIKTEPGLIHDDPEVEYVKPLPKEPVETIDLSRTQEPEEKNDFEERSRFHPFNVITSEEAEQEQADADKRRAKRLKLGEIKKEKTVVEEQNVIENKKEVEETEEVEDEVEETEEEEVEVEETEEEVEETEEEVEVEETEVEEEVEETEVEEEVEETEEEEVEVEETEETEETEEEVEETEEDDGEEEQEEVSMVHINGKHYYATNEKNGEIYEMLDDEEIGDEVGKYVNGTPVFH